MISSNSRSVGVGGGRTRLGVSARDGLASLQATSQFAYLDARSRISATHPGTAYPIGLSTVSFDVPNRVGFECQRDFLKRYVEPLGRADVAGSKPTVREEFLLAGYS